MKDDQITLRVPKDLARRLRKAARERGAPASQVVREALESYLVAAPPEPDALWQSVAPMVGSLQLDTAATAASSLADQIRAHNWRE